MSAEYFWIRESSGSYSAGWLLQEKDDGSCVFEEFGTQRHILGSMDSIVGSVAPPCDETLTNLKDDLVQSDDISEPSILWNLSRKFQKDLIYSSIGSILVSVNPYRPINSLFNDQIFRRYIKEGLDEASGVLQADAVSVPHIWSIAKNAYVHLCAQGHKHSRQAVVISGESGSGKTEATKRLMGYLSAISSVGISSAADSLVAGNSSQSDTPTDIPIADKVMGMNPLLESFGNAKTLRNDNSSRFGRWLQIHFKAPTGGGSDIRPRLTGADISEYLLEKSRVVVQARGERNYHIFYQLLADESMGMQGPDSYAFLNASECTAVEGVDDAAEFANTLRAFRSLGMDGTVQEMMLSTLKGILFLGNLAFEEHSSASGDGSRVTPATSALLDEVATCFSLPSVDALQTALTVRSMMVRGEKINVFLSPKQAADCRHALAKEIYSLLFKFIVAQANKSLMPSEGVPSRDSAQKGAGVVGLLDIFGFEIFQNNSLEQLSINFANEKLQQYFLHFVLKLEQDLYEQQGAVVERIAPNDNEDVLRLLEAPRTGIFARLDEELKLPKPSDEGFLRKIADDFAHNAHADAAKASEADAAPEAASIPRFSKTLKMPTTHFEIVHFAGTVRYDSTGFLEKNRDKLYDHMHTLLQESTSSVFRSILPSTAAEETTGNQSSHKAAGSTTLIRCFQDQLSDLMQTLLISEPHFVRCVKPNGTKSPQVLDESMVLEQLRYSGVLEAIQVRKRGYPIRRALQHFTRSYWVISGHQPSTDFWSNSMSDRDKCSLILGKLYDDGLGEDIVLGTTLVLMKQRALTHLEAELFRWKLAMALKLQCRMRRRFAGQKYALLSEARLQLRELVRQSKFRNSTNYAVYESLAEMIRYSTDDLLMKCSILVEANAQAAILARVKRVVDEAKNRATPEFSKEVNNIVEEHALILQTLAAAEALQLNIDHSSPEIEALIAREFLMNRQAVSLGKLRAAIANCNQENMESLLAEVSEVAAETNAGESFAATEEATARILLKQLRQDDDAVEECVQVLVEFQHAYEIKRGKPDAVSWLTANASAYGSDAARLLKSLRAKPSSSPTIRSVVTILFDVASSLQHWMDNHWDVLADVISGIMRGIAELKAVPCLADGELASDFKTRRVSKREHDRIHAYIAPIVDTHVAHLASDLELNFIVPRLANAYELGRLPLCESVALAAILEVQDTWTSFASAVVLSESADSSTVDFHRLATAPSSSSALLDAIQRTRAYLWLSEPVLELLRQLEIVANVRELSRLRYFDLVLAQTENADITRERRSNFQKLLKKLQACPEPKIKASISSSEVEAWCANLSTPESPEKLLRPFAEYDESISLGIGANLKRFDIPQEIVRARRAAKLQLGFHLICHALSRGSATGGNVDDVDYKQLDVKSLQLVIGTVAKLCDREVAIEAVERMLSQLVELRAVFKSGNNHNVWQAVLDTTSSRDFFIPSASSVHKLLASDENTSWDNVSHAILALRDEVLLIVASCKCNLATSTICVAISTGGFTGRYEDNPTTQLSDAIESAKWCTTGPMGNNGASQDLHNLLCIADFLLEARKAFSSNENVDRQRKVVNKLCGFLTNIRRDGWTPSTSAGDDAVESAMIYWSEALSISPLASELRVMRAITSFADCLDSIQSCLKLPSPVLYLVPIIVPTVANSAAPAVTANIPSEHVKTATESKKDEDQKPMEADNAPLGATTRRPSFQENTAVSKSPFGGTTPFQSPSEPIQESVDEDDEEEGNDTSAAFLDLLNTAQKASAMEAHRLIAEEKLRFNMRALSTSNLDKNLSTAKKLQKVIIDVSAEQLLIIRTAELMRLMRESILRGNWRDANANLGCLKDEGLIAKSPIIHEEVLVAAETIQSYIVISSCKEALKRGLCQGATGLIDYSNIGISGLEDVLHECSSFGGQGAASERAQELIQACWLMIDLRKAQKNTDWKSVKDVLTRCDEVGIARPGSATAVCYEEIARANIEASNWQCALAIKDAILKECIPTHECLIEIDQVNVTALSEAYSDGQAVKDAHRGAILMELLSLSDLILKARRAIQQSNWFVVNSVVTLWRQEADEFRIALEQLEVDSSPSVSSEIVSRRFSIVRRSSVLSNSPRKGSKGNTPDQNESSSVQAPQKARKVRELWSLFADCHQSMIEELKSIDNHFATLELETAIYTALRENGMTIAMVGNVDRFKIKIDPIATCQLTAANHERQGLVLSQSLTNVFKASNLIKSIRMCIIDDTWDSIPKILEESVTGRAEALGGVNHTQNLIPDMCRKELEAVRYEIENRWILSNITSSLEYGQLGGTLECIDYSQVSYEHLTACITSCKDLTPRTDAARNLIHTAEIIVPMRKLLKARTLDYFSLRERANEALSPKFVAYLHLMVLPEIRLIHSFADDHILCVALQNALQRNGPSGVPGRLETATVNTGELDRVLVLASSTTIRTQMAANLLNACRTAKSLRMAILRTTVSDPSISAEAWGTIRQIVMKLHEGHRQDIDNFNAELAKKKLADGGSLAPGRADPVYQNAGWDLYEDEVTLITRDAHITEVKVNLEESIEDTLKAYSKRLGIPIDPAQDWQELPSKHSKQKLNAASMIIPARFELQPGGLAKLVNYAQNLDFRSDILNQYIDVCTYLKGIRQHIMNGRWSELETMLYEKNDSLHASLNLVPLAFAEIEAARAEHINHEGTNLLLEALLAKGFTLKSDNKDSNSLTMMKSMGVSYSGLADALKSSMHTINRLASKANAAIKAEDEELENLHPEDSSSIHQGLLDAIRIAKRLPLTSLMSTQLMDCAAHTFQLRVSLSNQNSREVSFALKWMRQNSRCLPKFVQQEAKDAYVEHQNYLLELGLNRALLTGFAKGPRGCADSTTIVLTDLSTLLEQAKELKVNAAGTTVVTELVAAAEDVLLLRTALKKRNFLVLHDALDIVEERRYVIHPLIMNEVFSCRTELNNEISTVVLQCALASFSMDVLHDKHVRLAGGSGNGATPASEAFLRVAGNTAYLNFKSHVELSRDAIKAARAEASVSMVFVGNPRAYCPHNIHHADVDPDTITVDIFSEALTIAAKCGVYSEEAITLYHSVVLLRKLRIFMKAAKWADVESALREADFIVKADDIAKSMELIASGRVHEVAHKPPTVDLLAVHELVHVQNQLEIRESIAEVQRCLRVGWARCSNGVVNTKHLEVDPLRSAVGRCRTSVLGEHVMHSLPKSQFGVAETKTEEKGVVGSAVLPKTASAAQEQIELMLKSAASVLKVRQCLKRKNAVNSLAILSEAGGLAADALKESLHASVVQELTLYAKEVHRALKVNELETELRLTTVSGDMVALELLILRAREVTSMHNIQLNDLGLVLILQRAQAVYKAYSATKRALRKSLFSFNQTFVENALECAKLLQLNSSLVADVQNRLSQICRFEMFVMSYRREHHGALTEDSAFHAVLSKAGDLGMTHHPWAHEAAVCLRLSNDSLSTLLIAASISNDNGSVSQGELKLGAEHASGQAFIAATETMRIKRHYLSNPTVRQRYALSNFPHLRVPKDFALHMSLTNRKTMSSMIHHVDESLGTSLTVLNPELSALSVWMFGHCIRGIERSIYTRIEVQLKKLVCLGRTCVRMRDEIFLQFVKQLRDSPAVHSSVSFDANSSDRLWRSLCACLAHFPPSASFESYFEVFLITQVEEATVAIAQTNKTIKDREANANKPLGVYSPAAHSAAAKSKKENKEEDLLKANVVMLKGRREYARLCVRLMHESIFLYGYDRKITSAFGGSLDDMLSWLTADDIRSKRCVERSAVTKFRFDTSVKHAIQAKREQESNLVEDPGWNEPPLKTTKTVANIKRLLSNTHNEAEDKGDDKGSSIHVLVSNMKKNANNATALSIGQKLGRIMQVKRQSMVLDAGTATKVSAPFLSESKSQKKGKVGFLSSKLNATPVALSDRVEDYAVGMTNKEGGIDVMTRENMTDFVTEEVSERIQRKNAIFGDREYWIRKLAVYKHGIDEDIGIPDLSIKGLCLKITGCPLGSSSWGVTAASKLFSMVSNQTPGSSESPEEPTPEKAPTTIEEEIMLYLVVGRPVTRMTKIARMHRFMLASSLDKQEGLRGGSDRSKRPMNEALEGDSGSSGASAEPGSHTATATKGQPSHTVAGCFFFAEEENALSDRRVTFLRRVINLHKMSTGVSSQKPSVDDIRKFWNNVISYAGDSLSKTEGGVGVADSGSREFLIDPLLFRDLICVGLDLLMNDKPSVSKPASGLASESSEAGASSLKPKGDEDDRYSRAHPPRPPRVNEEGYHVYSHAKSK